MTDAYARDDAGQRPRAFVYSAYLLSTPREN